jgi:HEAT repeat protein
MTQIGVFTTDSRLVIQVWDAALAQLTGISEETASGRELTALVPELEQRGLLKRFQRSLNNGVVEVLAPAFHHYLIPCAPVTPSKHFDQMQQRVTIAPLRDDNTIAGLIVTIEDVTERLEREREAASPMLKALSDEDWRVRREAVQEVSQRAAPEAIAALLNSVVENHHNPALLNSALQVLAASEVDTLATLTELLQGPNPDLRMQAALALGEQRDVRAARALVKSLHDDDTNVRYHAIEALGKLKATDAVDALAEIAASRDFFLSFAALDALAKIGDPRVLPAIVQLLDDELLHEPAIGLLGQLGDETVVAPLTALLNTPAAPTAQIANAFATLSERYEQQYGEGRYIADLANSEISATGVQNLLDSVEAPGQENLRAIALVLGWLKRSGVDRALTRLLGRVDLRDEIIDALVRNGSANSEILISQLTSEDLEVRRSAVVALGRIGDTSATSALVNTLDEESLAIDAANALAQIGDPEAVDGLLNLIGSDDASIRQAAVSALNSVIQPAMSVRIIPLLHDSDPNVRESAVKIAGYFGYPDAAGALVELSGDPNERVRCAAIEHLPYVEDDRVFAVLVNAIKDETPNVRAAAARALGTLDAPEVVRPLIEGLSDEDVWVRYFSARALGRRRSEDSVAALKQVIEREEFNHVRIAALDSLGQIGGDRVAGIVSGLVKDDDPNVAHAAQVAFGKSGQRE